MMQTNTIVPVCNHVVQERDTARNVSTKTVSFPAESARDFPAGMVSIVRSDVVDKRATNQSRWRITMPRFTKLAIDNVDDLLFGSCPKPLTTRRGLVIGGGEVIPEINFTLDTMTVEASTMKKVVNDYRSMVTGVLDRAVQLEVPGIIVEFETVPPMTEHPDWGMAVVDVLLEALENASAKHQLSGVLRMTPNDNREFERPPIMRSGYWWDNMVELFDRSSVAGAELLSIESVGGKEIHDEALTMGDLRGVIFSLCIMGCRDMRFLWSKLDEIARKHNVHCAGDTACGFGNTAMVLAEQNMIPRVFAAVVRAITAVRSLVAYECGAVGPGKDCGYENIILKAITGYPMANEGKTAACAHLSPVGNVAAAACDTWSNESVQNVKLLGAMAPVCSMEGLAYDCRLMNQAAGDGDDGKRQLRKWLVASDAALDAQAYMITPSSALRLANTIVNADGDYAAGKAVANEAVALLREAHAIGELKIAERELPWLDMMQMTIDELPDDEDAFIAETMPMLDASKFIAGEYELPTS